MEKLLTGHGDGTPPIKQPEGSLQEPLNLKRSSVKIPKDGMREFHVPEHDVKPALDETKKFWHKLADAMKPGFSEQDVLEMRDEFSELLFRIVNHSKGKTFSASTIVDAEMAVVKIMRPSDNKVDIWSIAKVPEQDEGRVGGKVKGTFQHEVANVMKDQGFSEKEVGEMEIAMSEVLSNTVRHCKCETVSASAEINPKEATVNVTWPSDKRIDIRGTAEHENAEIARLSKKSDKEIEQEYFNMVDIFESNEEMGGMHMGLFMALQCVDHLTPIFDKNRKEMNIILVKKRSEN